MSNRVIVRSEIDNHVLFSVFKAYYPHISRGEQSYLEHKHTELEISSILNGSGIYSCDGVDYSFSPGDIFFHRGNDIHYIKSVNPGDKPALIVIRFDPRLIWSTGGEWFNYKYLMLFMQKHIISCRIMHDCTAAMAINVLLEEIFQECYSQPPIYDLFVKAKLMTILANMARNFHTVLEQDNTPAMNKRHLAQMENSMNYILSHLDKNLTLDLLSKEACMSRSYYSTMFKNLNGVPLWDYITGQRIDLAQYQLETTDKTITQICESSGFNSIANFNRAFKKMTGKTPREYRNHMQKNNGMKLPAKEGKL